MKMDLSKIKMLLLLLCVIISSTQGASTAVAYNVHGLTQMDPNKPILATNTVSLHTTITQEQTAPPVGEQDTPEPNFSTENPTEDTTVPPVDERYTQRYTSDYTQPDESTNTADTIELVCPYNHSDHILYIRWYKVSSSGSVYMLTRKDIVNTDDTATLVGSIIVSYKRPM